MKTCKLCGTELKNKRSKFCNHSCAAKFHNVGSKKNMTKKSCLLCGETTKNTKYCNNTCYRQYTYNQYIERWLLGLETGSWCDGLEIHDSVKRWLKEQRGEKCEICEWAETNVSTKKVPLQVHHIDGNGNNNKPENLQLLCPNCHSLTPNFGNLNKGKGRKKRYYSSMAEHHFGTVEI